MSEQTAASLRPQLNALEFALKTVPPINDANVIAYRQALDDAVETIRSLLTLCEQHESTLRAMQAREQKEQESAATPTKQRIGPSQEGAVDPAADPPPPEDALLLDIDTVKRSCPGIGSPKIAGWINGVMLLLSRLRDRIAADAEWIEQSQQIGRRYLRCDIERLELLHKCAAAEARAQEAEAKADEAITALDNLLHAAALAPDSGKERG